MAYATETELRDYLDSQVLDRLKEDADGHLVDLSRLLDDASGQVDAALRAAGYVLPLPQPYPTQIRMLTCKLAARSIYARRATGELPVHIVEWLRSADDDLRAIAERRLQLPVMTQTTLQPFAAEITSWWDWPKNV